MFEQFTEKARRAIFFGRYEASQFGSPYIESEHLLLGLLREDLALATRFLRSSPVDGIREEIKKNTTFRQPTSTSADLPLSNECKRALAYAAEEAERLSHKHIGTEHLLMGLLREEKCFAAQLLIERSVNLEDMRKQLSQAPHVAPERATESLSAQARANLVAVGPVHPLVGREAELGRIIHILGCFNAKNPVLVGEMGVGKRTIVGGLAQRIANGQVPSFLAQNSVVELDLPPWGAIGSAWYQRFHDALPKAAEEGAILFVDDLHTPAQGNFGSSAVHLQEILKRAVVNGQVQCISVTTPAAYAKSIADHGWLESCFQPIKVVPASEADSVLVLHGIKKVYEEFHGVRYTDDALTCAVAYASACIPDRHLPGKAVDVIDEAGSCAKLRHVALPEEVVESQKRIRFIKQRIDACVDNHEFEKARFYSGEEKAERENLRVLREKYKEAETETVLEVTPADIEGVVSRWTGATIEAIGKSLPLKGDGSERKTA